MKKVYGRFCSRHNEAVNFYKDLLTKDKRFKAFIKVSNISASENFIIYANFDTQKQQKLFTVHQPRTSECVFVCVHEVSKFSHYLMSTLTETQRLLSLKSRHYYYYYLFPLSSLSSQHYSALRVTVGTSTPHMSTTHCLTG